MVTPDQPSPLFTARMAGGLWLAVIVISSWRQRAGSTTLSLAAA